MVKLESYLHMHETRYAKDVVHNSKLQTRPLTIGLSPWQRSIINTQSHYIHFIALLYKLAMMAQQIHAFLTN